MKPLAGKVAVCGRGHAMKPAVVLLGGESRGGTYVLRVRLERDVELRFGGFKGGKLISLRAGEYVYVGSALAERGAASLGRRLVRHATRSGRKRPHKIRAEMLARFGAAGLGEGDLLPRGEKRLRWNVDYLLDLAAAELVGAYAVRSGRRLEGDLGRLLEEDPQTAVFEKGLGANDLPGNTHLLRVEAGGEWWAGLEGRLKEWSESRKVSKTC